MIRFSSRLVLFLSLTAALRVQAVEWKGLTDATLAEARTARKPVLLVIDAQSCPSCRALRSAVEDIAADGPLIGAFTTLVIDADERPEIARGIAGRAESPAAVVLTPDLLLLERLPSADVAALREALQRLADQWKAGPEAVLDTARLRFTASRSAASQSAPPPQPLPDAVERRLRQVRTAAGDSSANEFLLALSSTGNSAAQDMLRNRLTTLDRSALHDQLGGGFHDRLETDSIPFFDKRLEDQARLSSEFLQAWQLTGDERYRQVARTTLDFVIRDLKVPTGGFATSHDSRSFAATPTGAQLVEGAYFFWEGWELRRILGEAMAARVRDELSLSREGKSLPRALRTVPDEPLSLALAKLLQVRSKRPEPRRDDRVIASYNGMIISALANAGAALGERNYVDEASRAADFIKSRLFGSKHYRLAASVPALPEDYAWFIRGLLDLYEATLEARWLGYAIELQKAQDRSWSDASRQYAGGIAIPGVRSDADAPSQAVSAINLYRLASMTAGQAAVPWELWRARAIAMTSSGDDAMIVARLQLRDSIETVVVFGRPGSESVNALITRIKLRPRPARVLIHGGYRTSKGVAVPPYVRVSPVDIPADIEAAAVVCRSNDCSPFE
jgi:uncharacterized protein